MALGCWVRPLRSITWLCRKSIIQQHCTRLRETLTHLQKANLRFSLFFYTWNKCWEVKYLSSFESEDKIKINKWSKMNRLEKINITTNCQNIITQGWFALSRLKNAAETQQGFLYFIKYPIRLCGQVGKWRKLLLALRIEAQIRTGVWLYWYFILVMSTAQVLAIKCTRIIISYGLIRTTSIGICRF